MNTPHDPEEAGTDTSTAMTDQEARSMRRRTVISSLVGNVVEWFDFYIYGFAAATIFNVLFFPEFDPLMGTLAAFATFAAGFIARPFGGILWGHFGDRIGRKKMLVASLVLMGLATALIGALPTYAQIGIFAPLLLVFLRIVQGLAAGGEWGGAILMITEHYGNSRRRGLWGSVAMMGTPLGITLATGTFALLARLPEQAYMSWGWRIPFLSALVLGFIGLWIRLGVVETPLFRQEMQRRHDNVSSTPRIPLLEVLRNNPRNVILGILLVIGPFLASGVYLNFGVTYATTAGIATTTVLNALLVAKLLQMIWIPLFGALSDLIGRRPVYFIGSTLLSIGTFLMFWVFSGAQGILMVFVGFLVMTLPHSIMYGTMGSFLAEQFGTSTRYTGISLGYQVAGSIGGGLAPGIAVALFALTGGTSTLYVSLMVLAACALSFCAAFLCKETSRSNLDDSSPEESTQATYAPGLSKSPRSSL